MIALTFTATSAIVKADAPNITVTAVWRPGTQLSTIDTNGDHQTNVGDDLRYVDLEIDATTNVEFWATEITCKVNPLALETFMPNSDPGGVGDNVAVVTWSPGWNLPAATMYQPYNPTTGAMTIVAANDIAHPLGKNTITTSFPLATIRYRVKPVTVAMASPVSCTGSFLNADGKPVLTPVFVMPPALNIIPSYNI